MRLVRLLLLLLAVPLGAARADEVPYTVTVEGVDTLRQDVEEASRLVALQDEPPSSRAALQRRADEDVARIQEVLRAEGYYDARVDIILDPGGPPVPVRIAITRGSRYRLESAKVHVRVPEGAPPEIEPGALGLAVGEPARARPVLDAERELLRLMAEAGHPLATVADRRVEVDHATNTMRIAWTVDAGPLARFGPVTVTGLDDVDEKVVRRRIPWEQGEVFSVGMIEAMRERLVESRLFGSIRIATAPALDANGQLPITIDLEEAKHRSIGVGLDWSSSEGFGTRAFWEHRNLFHGGEALRASVQVSETRNAIDLGFREPDFLAANQALRVTATAEEQRTEAFVTRTLGTGVAVAWSLTPTWEASAGTAFERTFEEEDDHRSAFTLVSLPLELTHDSTDDLLDPTRGNRLRAGIRPFVEPPGTSGFTRLELYDSHAWLLRADHPRLVAAAWGRVGSIRGASVQEVPADKRFFVGGGGSVRPFGYQMAGPVDADGDPTGGLSAIAFGGEVRVRVTDTIGVVPFLEAGRADASKTPDFGGELFWGAGLGLRYHTALGPVRADLAFPVNPRRDVDDAFQIYLSLGQAF